VVESEGHAFPVETRYLGRDPRTPIERQVADAVERALSAETGSLLVFLPGAGEIRRSEALLKERVTAANIDIVALYGALNAREQDRAISPSPAGRRKAVLATSIAETSLTIEGIRVVIDSGLSRVPRYEPDVGLTRLETVRVSRAAADQRRGRAGRTERGVCYRLWDEPQTGALEPYTRPEILSADLSSFLLDLASGARPTQASLLFSMHPRRARLAKQEHCSLNSAPSIPRAVSPRRAGHCALCRCHRGWRVWLPMLRPKALAYSPQVLQRSSRSGDLAAMTSILVIASITYAATARVVLRMPGPW
jgi:ATP-dependent helicase HrpB